jgi:hypothetical protein
LWIVPRTGYPIDLWIALSVFLVSYTVLLTFVPKQLDVLAQRLPQYEHVMDRGVKTVSMMFRYDRWSKRTGCAGKTNFEKAVTKDVTGRGDGS